MNNAKDLTQEAPASPRVRTGGYAILARMADKGRADIAGTTGEYHFDCPLDNYLFGFKGVSGAEVKNSSKQARPTRKSPLGSMPTASQRPKMKRPTGPTASKPPAPTTIRR